jgi:hypothetical protein
MKKYLMTGIAALAMCAGFTSCSHDIEPVSQEQLDQLEAEKVFNDYQNAFIKTFGQPAANQTWGFGGSAFTRSENANANEWADPNKSYGGLLVPPPLTPEQIAVVKKYFQTHDNLRYEDPQWTNYFIQQVYKGNPQTAGNSPEQYKSAAWTEQNPAYINASDHMGHLVAVDTEKGIVDHINNFNHGDCGVNDHVLKKGGNANDGPFYEDKIMYMMNSTTKSFGYYNTDGSLYHTQHTGLVSYRTIMEAMGSEADCLDDDWNRSFMGFDFEQIVGDDVYSKNVEYDYSGGWKEEYATKGWPIKSVTYNMWTWAKTGEQYHLLTAETNMYAADRTEKTFSQEGGVAHFPTDLPTDDQIEQLLNKGYLPTTETLREWVKVGGTADGYYSDWIVTLTEAKTNVSYPERTTLRVMAEDLSANEASDFDFNDVVLDFRANEDGTAATITLIAAGGTLPLRINQNDAWEVHKLFDVPVNTMVNTNATAKNLTGASKDPVVVGTVQGDFSAANFCKSVNAIKLEVYKNNQWMELSAKQGVACCKFGCDPSFEPVPERDNIDKYYNFSDWVKGFTTTLTKVNN